eukprot:GHVS01075159.1.p1 GENE.GHVS01075159.1~~GHVS01075159.1.p1  ORF type:complete len:932 (-),score=153.64 GHVS01075159.1:214-3009(-)
MEEVGGVEGGEKTRAAGEKGLQEESEDELVDIGCLIQLAKTGMAHSDMIHKKQFQLLLASHAVALMEPKTDSGCLPHLAVTIPRAIHEGLLRPLQTPTEVCVLLDGLLCNLYLWLCGHCPVQTIFSCLYLHYPPARASPLMSPSSFPPPPPPPVFPLSLSTTASSTYCPVMACSLSLYLLLCSRLLLFVQKANLPYREEDFPTHLPQELLQLLPDTQTPEKGGRTDEVTEDERKNQPERKSNQQEEEEDEQRTKKHRWEEVLAERIIKQYDESKGDEPAGTLQEGSALLNSLKAVESSDHRHAERGSKAFGWGDVIDRLRFFLELSRFVATSIDIAEPLPSSWSQQTFQKHKNVLCSYLPPLLSVEQLVGKLQKNLSSIRSSSTGAFTISSSCAADSSSSGDCSASSIQAGVSKDVCDAVMRSFDKSISRHLVAWQPPRVVPAVNIDEALSFLELQIKELQFVCREARVFLSSSLQLLQYLQHIKQVSATLPSRPTTTGGVLGDGVGNCRSMGILSRSFSYALMVRVEEVAKACADHCNEPLVHPFERSLCLDDLVLERLEKNGIPPAVSAGYWNKIRRELRDEAGGKREEKKRRNKRGAAAQHIKQEDKALEEGQNLNEEMAIVTAEVVKKNLGILVTLMQVGHLTLARQHRRLEHVWLNMEESCCYARRADAFAKSIFKTTLPYPAPMELMSTELVLHTLVDKLALGFRLDLYSLNELPHIYWAMERMLLWLAEAELTKQRLVEPEGVRDRRKTPSIGSSVGQRLWLQTQAELAAVSFRLFVFLKRFDMSKQLLCSQLFSDERWRCLYKHHVRFSRAESEVDVLPDLSPFSYDMACEESAREAEAIGLSRCLQRLEQVRANCETLLSNPKLLQKSVLRKEDVELLSRVGKKQEVTIRLLSAQRSKLTVSQVSTATHPVFLCPVPRYKTS